MKGLDLIGFLGLFGLMALAINQKAVKESVEAVPALFAPNCGASCQQLAGTCQACQLDKNADMKSCN